MYVISACLCVQDLKKYFDSSGGKISPKTVQVLFV